MAFRCCSRLIPVSPCHICQPHAGVWDMLSRFRNLCVRSRIDASVSEYTSCKGGEIPWRTLISLQTSPLPSPSSRPKDLGEQRSSFIMKYCIESGFGQNEKKIYSGYSPWTYCTIWNWDAVQLPLVKHCLRKQGQWYYSHLVRTFS